MLSKSQKSIVTALSPVIQVIAAAGSGKTRTVVELVEERLRQGFARPGRVLLLSFSRKACAEIRARLSPDARSAVVVSTFHALAFAWMRRARPVSIITDTQKEQFLAEYLRSKDTGGVPVAVLLKNKRAFFQHMPRLCFDSHRAFACHKRRTGALEFDDLVRGLLRGLASGEFEELKDAYDLVVVDEFQDTDAEQLAFLRLLRPRQLVVVGDDYQSIYSFRGSNPEIFLKFGRHFPGVQRFFLTENYRSYRQITDCGNQVIRHARDRLKKRVVSVRGSRPSLPASALALRPGEESALLPLMNAAVVLCRSNHRRLSWLRAGLPPDRVLTIHASKGLEFPFVFLDVTGGYSSLRGISRVPDEEVRIAYVGLTRAENFLAVMFDPQSSDGEPEQMIFDLFRPHVRRLGLDQIQALCAST
jgi:DNA helicase-2/ATP-dependent DNA helicase PcrA